jgi:hypothetical protein
MLSTRLTTTDNGILSHKFIPENIRALVERRTADNKRFGKLEIQIPQIDETARSTATTTDPRNIIAGFLLDTSGSMDGKKIQQAVNTIRKFVEVLHSERNGKTIQNQPIRAWIYLITFNSYAELIIPFQEITDETLPIINEHLDLIRTSGSTNYERAFQKQTAVLEEIIKKLNDPQQSQSNSSEATVEGGRNPQRNPPQQSVEGGRNPQRNPPQQSVEGGRNPQHYHMMRFFETDGEITEGSKNIKKLYEMMRSTSATATAAAAATTTRITFEDYVLGYGTDVDLGCLKQLASPFPPTPANTAATSTTATTDQKANVVPVVGGRNPPHCSSLVTIIKPEDIGWQVGDILFKIIMRYGFNVQVSIAAAATDGATAELFEYQTHQWGAETTLHSLIHGEKRPLWIQYTPPSLPSTDAAASPPPPPVVSVKIQYDNQFTGESYTYQFEHEIHPTAPESAREEDDDESSETIQTIVPLILGMIQIENLKQFREIEAARYDKDTIVREAYKTLRMLKSIDEIVHASFPVIACQTMNLMTDAKVIIGLTTIQNQKEQNIILHARRTCSAEQEMFNTGATVSRRYVPGEEEYEEDAIRVINAAKAAAAAAANPEDHQDYQQQPEDEQEESYAVEMDDALPSRIPTFMPKYNTQDDFMDTPFVGGVSYNRSSGGSEVRALCVRIAIARNKQEDTSTEELYQQMQSQRNSGRSGRYGGGQYDLDEYAHCYHGAADDTFSSTPMDDDYTQRRMGMMRQMSS